MTKKSFSKELKKMYNDDQNDRRKKKYLKNYLLMKKRSRTRLQRVLKILKRKKFFKPADYLRAAMILQHGFKTDHYMRAHQLAKIAAELNYKPKKDEPHPLWLAAAAKDRWLMSKGKRQLYGTQLQKNVRTDTWYLWPTSKKVTDKERAQWHVPKLALTYKRVKEMNR